MPVRTQLLQSFREKKGNSDFWLQLAVFILLGLAFWPITLWFAQGTQEQSRLLHAFVVLVVATVVLVRYGGVEIRDTLTLNRSARRALFTSFALLLVNFIAYRAVPDSWKGLVSLLIIPAYCCGLAAFVRFVFGEGTHRITRTTAGTFCGFLLLSIFMQPLDWPLRGLAGKWSASALELIGKSVELGLVGLQTGPPKLILLVEEHPFHVASECNGFGIIMTGLLIGLLLAIYRRLGFAGFLVNLAVGLSIGFTLNILRIVVIVLLAPPLMDHYMLMHEIVGSISFWAGLVLIWILLKGPTKPEAI